MLHNGDRIAVGLNHFNYYSFHLQIFYVIFFFIFNKKRWLGFRGIAFLGSVFLIQIFTNFKAISNLKVFILFYQFKLILAFGNFFVNP